VRSCVAAASVLVVLKVCSCLFFSVMSLDFHSLMSARLAVSSPTLVLSLYCPPVKSPGRVMSPWPLEYSASGPSRGIFLH
jgi:hypothetical protein